MPFTKETIEEALQCTIDDHDLPYNGPVTVHQYLHALLTTLWEEGEGFSGKRPFGNSGWEYDIYAALVKGGVVTGDLDGEGCLDYVDIGAANCLVFTMINHVFGVEDAE